jgi:hypothetical protein
MAKFSGGQVGSTPAALARLTALQATLLLARHFRGDWGDVCDADKRQNDLALVNGERVLSAYQVGTDRFWIITEWDRSVTTILLPSEY